MSGAPGGWIGEVVRFWFALDQAQWWKPDDELDAQIRDRFRKLWDEKRQLPVSLFLGDPLTALAGALLFDQFPRNMFRGHAEQFATDMLAQGIANAAVDGGLDERLDHDERLFLYMPFQHSERIEDQRRSLMLFTALGDEELLGFAKKHHDIVARFGRFPHRNAMLGRMPRADEIAAGDVTPF